MLASRKVLDAPTAATPRPLTDTALALPAAAPMLSGRHAPRAAGRRLHRFLSLDDFDAASRRHLPWMLHGFVAGAAEAGASLRGNAAAFGEYGFVPRVLADVSGRSQATTLFGQQYAAPFGIAPMGIGAICAYRADVVLARAALAARVPMVLSASSLIPLEDVRREGGASWYQAYLPGEVARIESLVDRVAAAGYGTFVLTADVPVAANRENNVRNGFRLPLAPSPRLFWDGVTHPSWLLGTALRTLLRHGMPHFENMDATRGPPILSRDLVRAVGRRDQLSWDHLLLIRRRWRGPLVVKGILSVADARLARERGADGIIVSNHGGRQLDGAVAPLRVLPAIKAVAGDMAVMLDGGIRRGTDVLKALALGADFVFVGRPFLQAAAVGGEEAVRHAIRLLSEEIDRDMALLGVRSLGELAPGLLHRTEAGCGGAGGAGACNGAGRQEKSGSTAGSDTGRTGDRGSQRGKEHLVDRRSMLHAAVPLALGMLARGRHARAAETTEVRFARQFSLGYLQFNVMEHRGLVEKHAEALGVPGIKTSWVTFNGPEAMNNALISDSVDVVAGGVPGLLTIWARTKGTALGVRGVSALSSQPILLNSRVPAVKTIADLTSNDRVALPTVKVSVQALVLEMAAAQRFGQAGFAQLDPLTVSMAPPDATVALLSGAAGVTSVFGVPPFQQQQLEQPGIHTILNSFDVLGSPHSFSVAWTSARFRDRSPTLYKALVAALREATDIVNADRRGAAQLWVEDTRSKLSVDQVERVVSGPQVRWTLAPEATMRFAAFMHDVGSIKAAPASWSELFFPEVHDLQGS